MQTSAIFRPVVPNQGVATLLLIENSQEMIPVWPSLRDQHLPTLIGTIRIANPVAPIKILMLTSSPIGGQSSPTPAPREYFELPNVRFNSRAGNKISVATICRGIDVLTSTDLGQPTARHLIIVAASAPSDDTGGFDIGIVGQSENSVWHCLAHKLMQEDIQCHMILNSNQNMKVFTELFYGTLRLQSFEEAPWFPADEQNLLFHLSTRPLHTPSYGVANRPCMNSPSQPLQRNYTFPLDGHEEQSPTPQSEGPESQPDVSTPSLVARLQKAHGLTKKKIYGAKPVRQPFFREERIHDHRRQAPPLTIPSTSVASRGTAISNQGNRAGSRSRADRRRLINSGLQGGTSDPYFHPRRQSSRPHRGSRVSSPEADATLASPTPVAAYGTMSPVPVRHDLDYLSSNVSSPISPTADDPCIAEHPPDFATVNTLMPLDSSASLVDPSWSQHQYLTSISPLLPSTPNTSHGDNTPGARSPPPCSSSLPPPAAPSGAGWTADAHLEPLSACPSTSRLTSSRDDGERPFEFNAEYEAVTAARMEEVLRSNSGFMYPIPPTTKSSSVLPSEPSRNFYFPSTPYSTPSTSSSSSRMDVTYADGTPYCGLLPNASRISPPTNKGLTYQLGSSSSLTGWAG